MAAIGTPLSDLIDILERTGSEHHYAQFIEEFRRSTLGVIAEGIPEGVTDDFTSTDQNPISVGNTADSEGRSFVLAFADPPAFDDRFGPQFNAEISGESLLDTVLTNPDCHGIRVNSAKGEVSVIIARETIQRLKRSGGATKAPGRPWWKFW